MSHNTLDQYLSAAFRHGVIDHNLRATFRNGELEVYICPASPSGEKRRFVVNGNTLAPLNEQHASDCSTNNRGVPELLGKCDCAEGPALDQAEEFAKEDGYSAGDHSCALAGHPHTELDDAISLGHCAANVADSLAKLAKVSHDSKTQDALAKLVRDLAAAASDRIAHRVSLHGPVTVAVLGDVSVETSGSLDITHRS